jgi:hypothetical protein
MAHAALAAHVNEHLALEQHEAASLAVAVKDVVDQYEFLSAAMSPEIVLLGTAAMIYGPRAMLIMAERKAKIADKRAVQAAPAFGG